MPLAETLAVLMVVAVCVLLFAGYPVALTLGGCGRKGPLDLPPTASSAQTPAVPDGDTETRRAAEPSLFNPSYGTDAPPAAAKGRQRPFLLDPLLGN